MSRFCPTPATAGGVVTGYLGTGLRLHRTRKSSPKRKRGYPGFRIRMLEFYVDEILAVCECMGTTARDFVYCSLLAALRAAALEIGMDPHHIARLNKRQRAAICHKYCLAADAIRTLKLERN
jgi:hypothetical protein